MLTIVRRRQGGGAGGESGLTLLEVLLGMTIFAVAALSVMNVMIYSMRLDASNKETAVATQVARRIMEQMRATPFDRVLADYNSEPKDDPDGEGLSPGAKFEVPELGAISEEIGSIGGEVIFPLDTNGKLREDLDMPVLGLPRDLSGDGKIDNKDPVDDFQALPVVVRVRWTGSVGERVVELHTVLRR
jgi:prepilin-type N-terminal cleavage/methylation domain-containing protein